MRRRRPMKYWRWLPLLVAALILLTLFLTRSVGR
jgi:hypothetical protein